MRSTGDLLDCVSGENFYLGSCIHAHLRFSHQIGRSFRSIPATPVTFKSEYNGSSSPSARDRHSSGFGVWFPCPMYFHISLWCSHIGPALRRMNSSTLTPPICGDRPMRFILPWMKIVMNSLADFPGTYPANYNEGTHLISGKGPTRLQVVPN